MKYTLDRTCKDCKNVDAFDLSKMEAAFELYNSSEIWKKPCSQCGSIHCESISQQRPKLDKELLDLWGNDTSLHLMEQDEEILLAEMEYLPLILQGIDESRYLPNKINILIEALCVLLYDNTIRYESYSDHENKERENAADLVRPELVKRKAQIFHAKDFVMDYIKHVVFPQIGIEDA